MMQVPVLPEPIKKIEPTKIIKNASSLPQTKEEYIKKAESRKELEKQKTFESKEVKIRNEKKGKEKGRGLKRKQPDSHTRVDFGKGMIRESGAPERHLKEDLKLMLYGFGDSVQPLPETIALVEDIVTEFIQEITLEAIQVNPTRSLTIHAIQFAVRNSSIRKARGEQILERQEVIKRELKKAQKDVA
eukprot:c11187_g1_i1.p1 GENE.c11187_g1_i1~~c11187_g1_i1.p1  ORF type:complete len:188 (+),score=82.69 c11187_g1_i1:34-597(+)